MRYYESTEQIKTIGSFISFSNGYYSFELDEGELIAFEEINTTILSTYELRSNKLSGEMFEVTYSIIIDDIDDEDFVILRLDDLKIIN